MSGWSQPCRGVVAVGHSEIIDRVRRAGRITQSVVNAAGTLASAAAGIALHRADYPAPSGATKVQRNLRVSLTFTYYGCPRVSLFSSPFPLPINRPDL